MWSHRVRRRVVHAWLDDGELPGEEVAIGSAERGVSEEVHVHCCRSAQGEKGKGKGSHGRADVLAAVRAGRGRAFGVMREGPRTSGT